MVITVRLFAMLRERAGTDSIEVELPDGAVVADALDALARVTADVPVVMAVNREYATAETPIGPGDEVALVPPVSGGADATVPAVRVLVTDRPLDPGAMSREVVCPAAGAVVTFQGVTRDVDSLDYEAYVEMAEAKMAVIAEEVAAHHGLEAVAVEHRVGTVPLGEPSVVVAVSAAHRDEAFAGARELIDRVKAEAPIWKREVEGERADWVEGRLPEA